MYFLLSACTDRAGPSLPPPRTHNELEAGNDFTSSFEPPSLPPSPSVHPRNERNSHPRDDQQCKRRRRRRRSWSSGRSASIPLKSVVVRCTFIAWYGAMTLLAGNALVHGWRWRLTSIPEEDIPCVVARSRGPKWDVGDELARKFNLGEQYFAEISGYSCPLFLLTIPLSICMQLPYGLTMPTNSRPCPSTPTRPSKSPNEPTTDAAGG